MIEVTDIFRKFPCRRKPATLRSPGQELEFQFPPLAAGGRRPVLLLGVAGDAETQQTDGVGGGDVDLTEQLLGQGQDVGLAEEHPVLGDAARDLLEVGILDLEGERAALEAALGDAALQFLDGVVEFDDDLRGLVDVGQEGLLATDRLALPLGYDGTLVDAAGEVVEDAPHLAELLGEVAQGEALQVGPDEDAHAVHMVGRLLPHAPDALHVELVDEGLGAVGMDDAEAVGLAVVAGYLGQELAVTDAGRCRQARLVLDALLDLAGAVDGQWDGPLVVGHVEEGLVERQGLDEVGIVVENLMNLGRHLFIYMEVGLDDHQRGTEAAGRDEGLGRVDAIAAGLVTGCGDDGPRPDVGHRHGQSTEGRIVPLLNGSIELIHVYMYDASRLHSLRGAKLRKSDEKTLKGALIMPDFVK